MRRLLLTSIATISLGTGFAYTSSVVLGQATAYADQNSTSVSDTKAQSISSAIADMPFSVKEPKLPFAADKSWAMVGAVSGEYPDIQMNYWNKAKNELITVTEINAVVHEIGNKQQIQTITLPNGETATLEDNGLEKTLLITNGTYTYMITIAEEGQSSSNIPLTSLLDLSNSYV